jgi:hypothetical protein
MNPMMRANRMDEPKRTTTKGNGVVPPGVPTRSVAWIIAASSFAFAVIQLDVTIVNVALSRISADLGATDWLPVPVFSTPPEPSKELERP